MQYLTSFANNMNKLYVDGVDINPLGAPQTNVELYVTCATLDLQAKEYCANMSIHNKEYRASTRE